MIGTNNNSEKSAAPARALGNTEHNWCRAVSSGTGITVLALQMAKPPSEIAAVHGVLHNLQSSHPLLASNLHYNPTSKTFSFLKTKNSQIQIKFHDIQSTSHLLSNNPNPNFSPFHSILEHELNNNNWSDPNSFPQNGVAPLFASVYALSEAKSVIILRFHTTICDRTTAVSLLMELMEMVAESNDGGGTGKEIDNLGEGEKGIETLIPNGTAKKTIWAHGMDLLGYSMNSFRLTNLAFKNTKMPKHSEVVRLQINAHYTSQILAGCESRGIKLCGALAAAALISAHSTILHSDKVKKKYGVVTLTDCRSILDPPLSTHHFGFYHSAILNIHTVKGTENFWDLAKSCYNGFAYYNKCNKHFSDLADLNFLMAKAIENPNLTSSSSLRTSLVSVFENPVIDDSIQMQHKIGVEDYMGCASVHGIGPSVAIFDTVRDGELDCICVYPAPLHSRDQMSKLVDYMRKVMIDGSG
ncbi:hypothetical protein CDL12_18385 [Handroanthus impetiginosus]|uniref:Condensation domain-containing protein n=1 Tax=Handroanthus impetiginosus TaxID=429701 RepID=A0A2G9GUS7_9LAMI|nr:hypothetical protein CDL12_18385 [Handroanthus impetiginosus]